MQVQSGTFSTSVRFTEKCVVAFGRPSRHLRGLMPLFAQAWLGGRRGESSDTQVWGDAVQPTIRMSLKCVAVLLPAVAAAAMTARGEFQSAVRQTPDLARGEEIFRTCAACHGTDGGGVADGTVPAIAGQHFRVIVKQLVDYRHDKRWDIRMEHFTDRHLLAGPQELADVAAYVNSLSRTVNAAHGTGEALQRGAGVYFRDCESCHGSSGQGDDARTVPRLAGQHYEYLVRQFYDAVDGRRPNMDREHVRLLSRLEREEIVGVSDYLSRLLPRRSPSGPGESRGDLGTNAAR